MSYDLLANRTKDLAGRGAVTLQLFVEPARVKGIQLLMQRVTTILLREVDQFGIGTPLVTRLQSGVILNDPQLTNLVAESLAAVRRQIPGDGAPEETLRTLRVISARKTADGVKIHLQLTNVAGETVQFEVPTLL